MNTDVMSNEYWQSLADTQWGKFQELFPDLISYSCPTVKLNRRFRSTGGVNYPMQNVVELAAKYIPNNLGIMQSTTLPHELAHQVDYNLFGYMNGRRIHGKNWCYIMVIWGLEPDPYHYMEL